MNEKVCKLDNYDLTYPGTRLAESGVALPVSIAKIDGLVQRYFVNKATLTASSSSTHLHGPASVVASFDGLGRCVFAVPVVKTGVNQKSSMSGVWTSLFRLNLTHQQPPLK